MTITEMKKLRAAALDKANAIQAAAEAEERELTDEQFKKFEGFLAEAKALDEQIQAGEKRAATIADFKAQVAGLSRVDNTANLVKSGQMGGQPGASVRPRWEDDPMKGFQSPRAFFEAVIRAGQGGPIPENLQALRPRAAVGSDEHGIYSDPYGGFLLPHGMSPNLLTTPSEGDPLAGKTTQIPMDVPEITIPARVDKDHTNSVSGGLRVYRTSETQTVDSSRMELEGVQLKATPLMGLTYATEQLIRYSPRSVAALLEAGMRDEFPSQILKERIRGTGAGQFLGILNSPALVTVPKETGQTADTIQGENILKMRKQCWMYSRALWLANHDTYDQLAQAHMPGTNSDVFLFNPGRGEDVPDRLLGAPLFFTEYASALGDAGDLMLIVPSEYLEGTLQPLESAESIHVRFIYNERAFRFSMMNAGAPWWRAKYTPYKGANQLSPFVTLAARA